VTVLDKTPYIDFETEGFAGHVENDSAFIVI